jgi:PAS domain S-box-containing protein
MNPRDHNRTEEALRRAALAVSSAAGENVFRDLARSIATILDLEIAFIALPTPGDPRRMRMLALYADGRFVDDYEYDVAGTPCETVFGRQFRVYPSALLERFPLDREFREMGVDSYAGYPLADAHGRPAGLMSVVSRRPITEPELIESVLKIFAARVTVELERVRADEALRTSEEQYRAIFNATTDGLVLRDPELRLVDVNPALLAMTGFTREETIGEERILFAPPELHDRVRDAYRRALAGEHVVYESDAVRRDGGRFEVEMRYLPIRYRGMPHVLAIARDITERKRAEAAMRASEEQYRAIFNASEDALVLWDAELRRVDVNPAYERLYGWSREEVVGRRYEAREVSPEYVEERMQLVRRSLAGESCHAELESLRKNGERFQADIRTIPVVHRGEPHVLTIVRNITERRQREEALRTSEEQYRAIFNASEDALVLWDSNLRRVDVNTAYQRLYGWTREEVIGRGYETLGVPEQFTEPRLDLVRRTLAGETCRVELESVRKNGEHFQADIRTIPFMHRGERHVLTIARDITERRQREEALRASEEQYRAIFNASFDGMIIRTLEGEIVDVNPALESMYGYKREELVGRTFGPIIPEERAESFRGYLAEVAAGRHFRTESHVPRRDGSRVYIEVLGSPVMYDGRPHVLSVVRDISERRAQESRLRATVEAALDSIVIMDEQGLIREFNPAAERAFGHRRADVIGKPLADTLIPPRLREAHRDGLARFLDSGAGPFLGRRVEVTALRADGSEFPAELAIATARGPRGRIFVGYLRDITAPKQAAERHRELEAQLRQAQKMEAIGHLTGGIAHDFNNILTGIMGYLTLASEREAAASDAKLARHLQQAQHGASRARELIQQMLTFSRAQKGKPRAVDLAALTEDAVRLLGSSLPSSVELRTELEPGLPAVMIDPVQVEQILLNLCINARDAMDGAGTIRVGVRLAPEGAGAACTSCHQAADGRYVELAVADSGPGIPQKVIERMFEPFFSTKEVGRGSGMGLATVHGIVHEHGGHIVVDTAPGAGAAFRVLLPALAQEAETAAPEGEDRLRRRPMRQTLEGRVLLVEDEKMVGEFMAELLGDWGLEVRVERNPLEAERWLAEDPARVDLVLTDQTMPGMTGLELARRAGALRPGLPVILYSGYAENLRPADLERCGVRALLAKPVEPAPLFTALAEALRR